jgi:cytochrome c556
MHSGIQPVVFAAAAAAILVAGVPQASLAQMGGDAVKERRAVMKDNSKTNKIVVAFVRKGKGSAAEVAAAGRRLAANATKLVTLFPKGTSLADMKGKTRAKPDIWLKWSDFEKRANALKMAGEKLAMVAAAGDAAAIKGAAGEVRKSCGGCHKPFRGPKPKK